MFASSIDDKIKKSKKKKQEKVSFKKKINSKVNLSEKKRIMPNV